MSIIAGLRAALQIFRFNLMQLSNAQIRIRIWLSTAASVVLAWLFSVITLLLVYLTVHLISGGRIASPWGWMDFLFYTILWYLTLFGKQLLTFDYYVSHEALDSVRMGLKENGFKAHAKNNDQEVFYKARRRLGRYYFVAIKKNPTYAVLKIPYQLKKSIDPVIKDEMLA